MKTAHTWQLCNAFYRRHIFRRYTFYSIPAAMSVFAAFKSRGSPIAPLVCLGPLFAEFLAQNTLKAPALYIFGELAIAMGFAIPAIGVCIVIRKRINNVSNTVTNRL